MGRHRRRIQLRSALAAWTVLIAADPGHAQNQVEVEEAGGYRTIESNGIPDHPTGAFPNRRNPNEIRPQRHRYRVPLEPVPAARTTPLSLGIFGVARNGVPFDPGAAEFWNRDRSWQYEALGGSIDLGLDFNNAHVQPTGSYHYHGIPEPLVASRPSGAHSPLLGWAADGFPIYARYGYVDPDDPASGVAPLRSSFRLRSGARDGGPSGAYDGTFGRDYLYLSGLGNLDECNGRTTKTPEYPEGTYAYFLTDAYPIIPRCLRGTPDPSFSKPRGRPPGGRGPPPGRRPPPPPPRR